MALDIEYGQSASASVSFKIVIRPYVGLIADGAGNLRSFTNVGNAADEVSMTSDFRPEGDDSNHFGRVVAYP